MKVRIMRTFITIKNSQTPGAKRDGFTIIELMLVVVIFAMLAGAGGYTSFNRYKRVQVEKAAKDIFLAAKYARILAVEKQARCNMLLDTKENLVCLTLAGEESSSSGTVISDSYTKPSQFAEGVNFEAVNIMSTNSSDGGGAGAEKVISFNSDGSAENAILQVGDGKSHYTVYILAATGKARIEFGEAEESPVDVIDLDVY